MTNKVASPAVVHAQSLERDPLKGSFRNFTWRTWKTLGYPAPSENHYEMADWLQHGPKKSITMGFRGMAKSYITVTFALWALYCDPDEMVLATSATTRGAGLNSFFAWQMISNFDWLAHMVPTSDQRRSSLAFDVRGAKPKKSESFAADSIFGQITSRRATLALTDDIEVPNTSDTEGKRQDLLKRWGEIPGAILLPGGREKVLGTAQTEQTIYLTMATEKGYAMRMFPILYPTPEERAKFGSWLAPHIDRALADNPSLAATSTEPLRFTEEDIADREQAWGRTEFARQFKLHLDAGAGNAAPLKLRDLIVMEWSAPVPGANSPLLLPPDVRWGPSKDTPIEDIDVDCLRGDGLHGPAFATPAQDWSPSEYNWMWVDPSGMGTDETTATVGHSLAAKVFISEQGKWIEGHTYDTLMGIAKLAKKWGVGYIYVEQNFGQGMFGALLRPCLLEIDHPCTIEEVPAGRVQKERRIIESLEPATTSHRVIVNRAVFEADFVVPYEEIEDSKRRFYRLTYQLTRMTKQKDCIAHDDRLEGLAALVAKFSGILQQRTQEAAQADKDRKMEEEVRKIIAARKAQGLPTFGAELQGIQFGRATDPRKSNFRATPPKRK